MFVTVKKFALVGIVAGIALSGSPASATYWWHGHKSKPNVQTERDWDCEKMAKAMEWRAKRLERLLQSNRVSRIQARYAYMHNANFKMWENKFQNCAEQLERPPATQSRQ